MYEQICFFVSTHPFVQFLVFVLTLTFGCLGALSLIFTIIGGLLNIINNNNKKNWQVIVAFCLTFIFSILIGSPFFVTFAGLQKYETREIKGNWLITKNKKIIYLNHPKIIKTNQLPVGFYYTTLGSQVKIESLPIICSLPVIDRYDSLCVLSNSQIIKNKKIKTKKFQVDSWAQNMPLRWKIRHYTFWMWEWKHGLSWKTGQLIKYTP